MWLCLLQVVCLSEETMPLYWNNEDMRNWANLEQNQQEYFECPNIRRKECKMENEKNIFLDLSRRVYKIWQDYLENITLLICMLCYHKNGVYSVVNKVVDPECGISPAAKKGRKSLRLLDILSTILGLAVTVFSIAELCSPVPLPFVTS